METSVSCPRYTRLQLPELREAAQSKSPGPSREILLAYAFLRGVPYRRVEPRTAPLPDGAADFRRRVLAHHVAAAVPRRLEGPATGKDAVLAWLAVPETPERAAWRLAREEAGRARRAARRAAHAAHAAGVARDLASSDEPRGMP